MPSECGVPIGIDRPAIYFRDVQFVLSHMGWPWVDETLALAMKLPNVSITTAGFPPAHWPSAVVDFIRRPGRRKALFASNFPTVGLRHGLGQLVGLDLGEESRRLLLRENALRLFPRLVSATPDPEEVGP
jgi:predicted TIM-barrel fold metal-dependent hydrolase